MEHVWLGDLDLISHSFGHCCCSCNDECIQGGVTPNASQPCVHCSYASTDKQPRACDGLCHVSGYRLLFGNEFDKIKMEVYRLKNETKRFNELVRATVERQWRCMNKTGDPMQVQLSSAQMFDLFQAFTNDNDSRSNKLHYLLVFKYLHEIPFPRTFIDISTLITKLVDPSQPFTSKGVSDITDSNGNSLIPDSDSFHLSRQTISDVCVSSCGSKQLSSGDPLSFVKFLFHLFDCVLRHEKNRKRIKSLLNDFFSISKIDKRKEKLCESLADCQAQLKKERENLEQLFNEYSEIKIYDEKRSKLTQSRIEIKENRIVGEISDTLDEIDVSEKMIQAHERKILIVESDKEIITSVNQLVSIIENMYIYMLLPASMKYVQENLDAVKLASCEEKLALELRLNVVLKKLKGSDSLQIVSELINSIMENIHLGQSPKELDAKSHVKIDDGVRTVVIWHPDVSLHQTPDYHPEARDRAMIVINRIKQQLLGEDDDQILEAVKDESKLEELAYKIKPIAISNNLLAISAAMANGATLSPEFNGSVRYIFMKQPSFPLAGSIIGRCTIDITTNIIGIILSNGTSNEQKDIKQSKEDSKSPKLNRNQMKVKIAYINIPKNEIELEKPPEEEKEITRQEAEILMTETWMTVHRTLTGFETLKYPPRKLLQEVAEKAGVTKSKLDYITQMISYHCSSNAEEEDMIFALYEIIMVWILRNQRNCKTLVKLINLEDELQNKKGIKDESKNEPVHQDDTIKFAPYNFPTSSELLLTHSGYHYQRLFEAHGRATHDEYHEPQKVAEATCVDGEWHSDNFIASYDALSKNDDFDPESDDDSDSEYISQLDANEIHATSPVNLFEATTSATHQEDVEISIAPASSSSTMEIDTFKSDESMHKHGLNPEEVIGITTKLLNQMISVKKIARTNLCKLLKVYPREVEDYCFWNDTLAKAKRLHSLGRVPIKFAKVHKLLVDWWTSTSQDDLNSYFRVANIPVGMSNIYIKANSTQSPLKINEDIKKKRSRNHSDNTEKDPNELKIWKKSDRNEEDTYISINSFSAISAAMSAVITAVDVVLEQRKGGYINSFCVGYSGRTEKCTSHGFCLVNNVCIGIAHARLKHGIKRIAVIDLDAHFGNGTADILRDDKDSFYASIHLSFDNRSDEIITNQSMSNGQGNQDSQKKRKLSDESASNLKRNQPSQASQNSTTSGSSQDFFGSDLPDSFKIDNENHMYNIGIPPSRKATRNGNILSANVGGGEESFRLILENVISPELVKFAPELIFISMGFDGHANDPLGGDMGLSESAYFWATNRLVKLAKESIPNCKGRIVSVLEGGYNTTEDGSGLGTCAVAHVSALCN